MFWNKSKKSTPTPAQTDAQRIRSGTLSIDEVIKLADAYLLSLNPLVDEIMVYTLKEVRDLKNLINKNKGE